MYSKTSALGLKIIFMGTPDYAGHILEKLISTKNIEVVAVYTQPDKPVGRKKFLTPPIVKTIALQNNIALYQPNRLRETATVEELIKIECDYIVVAAYGQILPLKVLEHAPCINLHASILPQYRGASPIQQTLLNGDSKTGVTAMLMNEGLDTGDIIKIKEISVGDTEMAESLFERLTDVACELTVDVLENFNSYTPIKQDDSLSSHCTKITKQEGEVAFEDAQSLYNKYRAFTPWPGIYLSSGLKLKKIELVEKESQNESGKILQVEKDAIVVGCKKGTIRVYKVQPESKNEMDVLSYINGKRLNIADTLS
ncbi:MAG: methionyl-tRNA formyltransferase [Sulfurimonas sp. RIFCSPHIGHO2_12_FULL_36_9]|uniref:methionyl-tRNA formyltransferase n=1 Tax=Sulfurimonas sp. RIFCSPLOWO2_12_36_12 TaxID=1802253 RepID=UPI0008D4AEB9|nr:methionyl-tRNA formyltransferase [Sulfurimonas sp. RIFCSPLOWO2_12_36_12]OHD97664.1 MAG: methionyl-tRNA formyltransferase [Sulfurimonas sp. RIFCSPHIGHO2_12_FULL_36_9]OHD98089.1 MAG: methionyl-tRNA formyltransferase [Sulfurimonas sp. RIFCSPLOWO2_02_FULL_36_28]OHE01613.1 MAG: methionyl-tRNA formyltransferase [Sulfurimonas sp. RIFCSPLOWO2_12_36_12]OHE03097.1 MAG: methionyl-tRNA formyltransferase [Sulfurimonas sp. RIFCSPLOWO2_12_FULL_36_74]